MNAGIGGARKTRRDMASYSSKEDVGALRVFHTSFLPERIPARCLSATIAITAHVAILPIFFSGPQLTIIVTA